MSQRALANAVVGTSLAARVVTHHVVGLVSPQPTNSGAQFVLDVRSAVSADPESSSTQTASASVVFETATIVASTVEGSVGQQSEDSTEPVSGVSGLVLANRDGITLLDVPPSAMASTIASVNAAEGVYGYAPPRASLLQGAASQGFEFILPEQSMLTAIGSPLETGFPSEESGFTGGGDLAFMPGQVGYLIAETFKGGGAPIDPDPASAVMKTVRTADIGIRKKTYASVSLATGGLTFTPAPDLVSGSGDFPFSLPFQRTYQSDGGAYENFADLNAASAAVPVYEGPDQDSTAFLGAGWTHNFDIRAKISSDAERALGRVSAVDASATIAGISSLGYLLNAPNGLGQNAPTFQARLASVLTAYWLGRAFTDNTVVVSRLPAQEVFTQLPDGRFNPAPGAGTRLTQSGVRTVQGNAPSPGIVDVYYYDYTQIGFTYTDRDGAVLTFDTAGLVGGGCSQLNPPVSRNFKADSWVFPNGLAVGFNYLTYNAEYPVGCTPLTGYNAPQFYKYYLSSVNNTLGRSLTFSLIDTYAGEPTNGKFNSPGLKISAVTDENGRQVNFALSNCPALYGNNGSGILLSITIQFACNTFTVTGPDGGVTKYDYTPGSDSPDPAWITKPSYHLRRWYTPGNTTTPFEVFAYDDKYRAATATDILGHQTKYYPGGFADEPLKPAETIDPVGNASLAWFDQWNSNLKSTDPLGRSSYKAFDGAHRPILSATPLMICTATAYDVRSNAVSSSVYPAGGCAANGYVLSLNSSPGTPLVTYTGYGVGADLSTYSAPSAVLVCSNLVTCNKPTSSIDAMGYASGNLAAHTATYSWDAVTGNLTQILKPADGLGVQPETDLAYTPLTGSSACTNGATANGVAMLCQKTEKISASASQLTTYSYNAANKYVLATATVDPSDLNLRTCFKFDTYGNLISTSDPRLAPAACP
jgi:hypothetical protein